MAKYMTIPEIRQLLNARDKFFLAEHSIDDGLAYLSQAHNVARSSALDYLAYMKTRNGSSPAFAVERISKVFANIHFPREKADPTPKPEPRTLEVDDSPVTRKGRKGGGMRKMLVEVQKTAAAAAASAASAADAAQRIAGSLGVSTPPPADVPVVSSRVRPANRKPEPALEEITVEETAVVAPDPEAVTEVEAVEAEAVETVEIEAVVEADEAEAVEVEEAEAVEVEEAEAVEVEEAEVVAEAVEVEEAEVEEAEVVEAEPEPEPEPKPKPKRTRRTKAASGKKKSKTTKAKRTTRTRKAKAADDDEAKPKKKKRRKKKVES